MYLHSFFFFFQTVLSYSYFMISLKIMKHLNKIFATFSFLSNLNHQAAAAFSGRSRLFDGSKTSLFMMVLITVLCKRLGPSKVCVCVWEAIYLTVFGLKNTRFLHFPKKSFDLDERAERTRVCSLKPLPRQIYQCTGVIRDTGVLNRRFAWIFWGGKTYWAQF